MSTKIKAATSAKTLAFYDGVETRVLTGLPLYERMTSKDAVILSLVVDKGPSGKLYLRDTTAKKHLVRTPNDIYEMLDNGEFEEGEEVLASVFWKKPIPGISEEALNSNYASNPNAIANYKAELKGNFAHLYLEEMH